MRSIALDLVDRGGTRAHEAHLPLEHVPELRQLVEMPGAKLLAERGDPRIVLDLEDRPLHLVAAGQAGPSGRGGLVEHGAELVQPKQAAVEPDPPLREERRPGRVPPDPGRVPEVRHAEGREPRERARHVDETLARERGEAPADGFERQDALPLEPVELLGRPGTAG